MPTAILSAHSGGFGQFSFHDLTGTLTAYGEHWRSLGLSFEGIYSGFLGSAEQIDIVSRYFEDFGREGCLVAVDPVMADNGKLYKTYTEEMQVGMGRLVEKAQLIMPNLTEASLLLGEPYSEAPRSEKEMKALLMGLSDMGPDAVVVKSLRTADGQFANIGYRRSDDLFWQAPYERIPVSYPGTGDIFGGVLIAALLTGKTLQEAMEMATSFVSLAVKETYRCGTPAREGVIFEKVLGSLLSFHTSE